jgi:hypothetical protein
VHGLLSEAEGGVDTYSLDFAHPLSPLVAFGAVLAARRRGSEKVGVN